MRQLPQPKPLAPAGDHATRTSEEGASHLSENGDGVRVGTNLMGQTRQSVPANGMTVARGHQTRRVRRVFDDAPSSHAKAPSDHGASAQTRRRVESSMTHHPRTPGPDHYLAARLFFHFP